MINPGEIADTIRTVSDAVGPVAKVLFGPLVGGTGAWAYLVSRQKSKSSIIDSQAGMVDALNAQTKMLLGESRKDRVDLKRVVYRQGMAISKLSMEVADCKTSHAECEIKVLKLRGEIAEMIAKSGVATYPHGGANAAD